MTQEIEVNENEYLKARIEGLESMVGALFDMIIFDPKDSKKSFISGIRSAIDTLDREKRSEDVVQYSRIKGKRDALAHVFLSYDRNEQKR